MVGDLLGDSISESAEQHQDGADGEGRERAAPDEHAPGALVGGHGDGCLRNPAS